MQVGLEQGLYTSSDGSERICNLTDPFLEATCNPLASGWNQCVCLLAPLGPSSLVAPSPSEAQVLLF